MGPDYRHQWTHMRESLGVTRAHDDDVYEAPADDRRAGASAELFLIEWLLAVCAAALLLYIVSIAGA
jgi:hypothetical protein